MKNLFHNFFCAKKIVNQKFSQNLTTEILQKVKFNIPQIDIKNLNKNLLSNFSIKITKPIFVIEESELNESYAKSLFLASLICKFAIVVMCKNSKFCKFQYKKFLTNVTFLQKQNLTKQQKELIYNLNINFACQNYDIATQNKIFVNNKKINNFIYNNYCIENKPNKEINIKKYYFNGNYYFFKNKLKNNKIIIKKILFFNKNNYLLLNKNRIINILTNEKIFILSNIKIKTTLLKNKNGDYILTIFANSNQDFVVYIGKEKINIFDEMLEQKLQMLLQNQFANKITSANKKLEHFFNNILPQKIVKNQIEDIENCEFEKQYYLIKNKIVSIKNNQVSFNKNFCQIFVCTYFGRTKKITFIKTENEKKIVVDENEYQNCDSISLDVFKKYNNFDVYY